MDLLSLGFVLLIALASGGIAYAADRLGKKLGKKRLSVRVGRFSIRPKHVASLGTAGMGFVVSLLTIVFVAAVSRDAREWLVEGRGLLVRQKELKGDIRTLEGQRADLTRRNTGLQEENAVLSGKYKGLVAKLVRLNGEILRLNASLKTSKDQLAGSQAELAQVQSQLASVRSQLEPARAQAALARRQAQEAKAQTVVAKAELVNTQKSLVATKAELGTAGKNLNTALKKLNDALKEGLKAYQKQRELETQVADLEGQKGDREAVIDALRKETAARVAQRDEAEAKAAEAQGRLTNVQSQLQQAGQDLDEVLRLAKYQSVLFQANLIASRLAPLSFRAGEEVWRVPVPAGADADAAARALASLLRGARAEALARGAKAKTGEPADVFDRVDPQTSAPIPADSVKRGVVAAATNRLQDQVLVATSSLNAFAGERVSLEIAVAPNPVVYRRDQMVAEGRIDGSLDEGRILDQLSEFVRSRVRERAQQDHMIPRAGSDAPFGEVRTGDLLAVVRDVKREGRAVRVQAFAGEDTHAADPLRLEFRVR